MRKKSFEEGLSLLASRVALNKEKGIAGNMVLLVYFPDWKIKKYK